MSATKKSESVRKKSAAQKKTVPKLPKLEPTDDSAPKFDVFAASKRSEIMRKVKSTKNKSTELRLMEEFKRLGVTGWRRQAKLFGKPDFLFPKLRIAVFLLLECREVVGRLDVGVLQDIHHAAHDAHHLFNGAGILVDD
ncbi:MAG: hypothetical protein II655_08650, partial [Thermoguttaceae bacterium]|nr:hypothetical protein [Thermoguttaceae bacterium]